MITLEQAKALKHGDILHHITHNNADGTPERWRVNGAVQTWKTRPNDVCVPLKRGLREYDYLDKDNLPVLCLTEEEALNKVVV
ncbi:MAG: hypothetical protein KAS39_02860 [Actinomycetia bacterium]|nr:hypothetical protein [Actinomycetes bacterium]